jgi:hypothetical protein
VADQVTKRMELLNALKTAAHEYTAKERTRLKNEVLVLKSVLDGRTGGAGIQRLSTAMVSAAAQRSLDDYLNPPK